MKTFFKFLYEFLGQFFEGLWTIILGLFKGIGMLFNFKGYADVVRYYKDDLHGFEWVLVVISIILVLGFIVFLVFLLYLLIRKYIKFRKRVVEQEELLNEVSVLNNEVANLVQEKQDILAMKVSKLGLRPNESDTEEESADAGEVQTDEAIRFIKLTEVDNQFADYKVQKYGNNFTLEEPVETEAMDINYSYFDSKIQDAIANYPIHQENLDKIEEMDNYVIQHFRIAFGNRIVAHMRKFVPVYVACGGDEVDGIDYFIARKILRKFEQLNIAYIRDEIDDFVKFLDNKFGKGKMKECTEYLLRLKKMS